MLPWFSPPSSNDRWPSQPAFERNALGAIKAVSAAALALRGDGEHFMPLDNCIRVMLETGRDMNVKYKETSTGGIAVNLPEC